jgi:DNA-binding response OmpR family regulator
MNKLKKILLLEDDNNLGETIEEFLNFEGFETTLVSNGKIARQFIEEEEFDIHIFDINIPELNGMDLLEILNNDKIKTPTIFISAIIDIKEITRAFELGAIDYLKKPFESEELLLRIKKTLKMLQVTNIILYKDIEYDSIKKILKRNGEIIALGKIQGNIFDKLITNIGNVIETEELLELLDTKSTTVLKSTINKIKKRTLLDIENVRNLGYIVDE